MSEQVTTKRLFIGTFLSVEEQDRLDFDFHQILISTWKIKLRRVRAAKLHLTWIFLGDLDINGETRARELLQTIGSTLGACELLYTGFELFPSSRNPRLIALTPDSVSEGCVEVSNRIRKEMTSLCQKKERDRFHPHITVIRFPREARGRFTCPTNFPPENVLPVQHKIDELCLIHSHYDRGQDKYDVLESCTLR